MPRGNDPTAAADLANEFGASAGNAEELINANNLRYSEDLTAANMLPLDQKATEKLDSDKIAKTADVDEVLGYAVRGKYVVYVAESPDGRTYKDVLVRDGDKLNQPEDDNSPQRAEFRARAEAAQSVREAKAEGEKILAEARQEANETIAKAQQEAEEKAAEARSDAQEASEKEAQAQESGARKRSKASTSAAQTKRTSGQQAG